MINIKVKYFRFNVLQAVIFICIPFILGGCGYALKPGQYRFVTEIEDSPSAYRNLLNRSENLTVSIKLRNLSERGIWLASDSEDSKPSPGLYVLAKLIKPADFIKGINASVDNGLRAGKKLKKLSSESHKPFFDRHAREARKLETAGPALLNLNRDDIISMFELFGNEAMVKLSFDVDWSQIGKTPLIIEKILVLELRFLYIDSDEVQYIFDQPIKQRIKVYFVNAQHGITTTPGNPVQGEFQQIN